MVLSILKKFIAKSRVEALKNTSPIQVELFSPYGLLSRAPKESNILVLKTKDGQTFVGLSIQQNTTELQDDDVVVTNGKSKVLIRHDGGLELTTAGGEAGINLSAQGEMTIKAKKINISADEFVVDANSAFNKDVTNQNKNIGADHTHKVTYDRHPEGGVPTIVTSTGVD